MEDIKTTFDIDIYKELEAENRDFRIYVDTGPSGIIHIDKNSTYEPKSPEGAVLCGNFKTPADLDGYFIILESGAAYLQYPTPISTNAWDKANEAFPYWWNNHYYDQNISSIGIGGFSTIYGTAYIEWKK